MSRRAVSPSTPMGFRSALPNALTLSRLGLAGAFVAALDRGSLSAATLVFAAICVTDVLDGHLARAWGCASRAGARLDAVADLVWVLAGCCALEAKGALPRWFPALVAVKFAEFVVTSVWLRAHGRNGAHAAFVYDKAGRAGAALLFLLPWLVPVALGVLRAAGPPAATALVVITVVVNAVATVGRLAACATGRWNGGYLWTRSS